MIKFALVLALILAVRLLLFYPDDYSFKNYDDSKRVNIPIISWAKEKITESFNRTLPPDASALLLGIVFGDKANLDKEYFEAIRATGVLHVIAASGMNVSMVAGFIFNALALFLPRGKVLIIATLSIIIYAAFAEFEESIVRASIMAIFAYGASLFGRQNTPLLALMLAAFIMIMWDPKIISAIGFQLSFAATAGIIMFDPIFKRFGNNLPVVFRAFLEDARTTISAQIATVPILMFYFETYSPVSIVSNLMILWTVPPLMILGLLSSIASLILPIIAIPFLWLSIPLLIYFKEVILLLNNFAPEFSVKNISVFLIGGYYTLILASIMGLWKRFKIRL